MDTVKLPELLPAVISCLLLTMLTLGQPSQGAKPLAIAVQPLGRVEAKAVSAVAECLRAKFGAEVAVLAARPLPPEAFYPARQRYRADKLLDFLERTIPPSCPYVIAVTSADISATKGNIPDWGIFGYAVLTGRVSVVSTFRLGRKPSPQVSTIERLQRVAVHEVGHLLGLEHCPHPSCVMQDAHGSIAVVDTGGKDFCNTCREHIKLFLRSRSDH